MTEIVSREGHAVVQVLQVRGQSVDLHGERVSLVHARWRSGGFRVLQWCVNWESTSSLGCLVFVDEVLLESAKRSFWHTKLSEKIW